MALFGAILAGLGRAAAGTAAAGGARHTLFGMMAADPGILAPFSRVIGYSVNWALPSLLPSPAVITDLYHSGRITEKQARDYMLAYGMNLDFDTQASDPLKRIWLATLRNSRAKLDVQTIFSLYLRKIIDRNEADERLHEAGMSNRHERQLLLRLTNTWTEDLIFDQYHRGEIDKDKAVELMERIGFRDHLVIDSFLDRFPYPGDVTVRQLLTRGLVTPNDADDLLRRAGLREAGLRQHLLSLAQLIPPPTDLVRFVVKDVFDEQLVARWGLDNEYEEQRARYEFWCNAQGLGTMTLPGNPDGQPINWPRMYYRAYWQMMSPTQAYTALHRFRPERMEKWLAQVPTITPFTVRDARDVLRFADYPQPIRDWLIGSSYLVPGRIDLRRMYRLGVLGSREPDRPRELDPVLGEPGTSPAGRELIASYQDLGYDRDSAVKLAAFTIAEDRSMRARRITGLARAKIVEAYRIGASARNRTAVRLFLLGIEDPVRRAEFQALPVREQIRAALADVAVRAVLEQTDFEFNLGIMRAQIAAIRRRRLRGIISENDARQELFRIGIQTGRADAYIRLWSLELVRGTRTLSANQVMQFARSGALTEDEARRRLANLGYAQRDVRAFIRQLERWRFEDEQREREREVARGRREENELRRLIRRLEEEQRRLQRQLAGRLTPPKMVEYVARRILTPEMMIARLQRLGWQPGDINPVIAEALQRRDERDRQRQRQRRV